MKRCSKCEWLGKGCWPNKWTPCGRYNLITKEEKMESREQQMVRVMQWLKDQPGYEPETHNKGAHGIAYYWNDWEYFILKWGGYALNINGSLEAQSGWGNRLDRIVAFNFEDWMSKMIAIVEEHSNYTMVDGVRYKLVKA